MGQEFSFLRMSLSDDMQTVLGDKIYAAVLLLGFHANEVQTFQLLLAANLQDYPLDPLFKSRAKITNAVLLRALCDRLYSAINFICLFEGEVRRNLKSPTLLPSFDHEIGQRVKYFQDLQETPEHRLLQSIRNKVNQHPSIQSFAAHLPKRHGGSSEDFIFHETKANSFFPASEDQIFGAFLHKHFGGAKDGVVDQTSYSRWLEWLIDSSGTLTTFVHYVCVWLTQEVGVGTLDTALAILDQDRIGPLNSKGLPLFLTAAPTRESHES